MKGVIVIPTFYKPRQNTGLMVRLNKMYSDLCKKYNFSVVYTDSPRLDGYDVAIISMVPYHNRPGIPPGLLNTQCKLIGEFGDLQCWDNQECLKNKEILFNRYDILLGPYYYLFRKWYPQHLNKYIYFPNYFGPYETFANLSINPTPKMRCLMIGARYPTYVRRNYVFKKSRTMPENGFVDDAFRIPPEKYPKYINNYFCALALPGVLDMPIAKYFEIPAAGSLLLATEVKEIITCGFRAGIHYVPVTKDNVFDQIKQVITHPDNYIEMRDRCTKFVRENHSNLNRFSLFEEAFNKLWPDGYNNLLRKQG